MKVWSILLISGIALILVAIVLGIIFRSAILEWMVHRLFVEEEEEEAEN